MDRATWKAIQMIMSDSQKFTEALHGVSWQEGLSDEIVRNLEPFFSKNELGELGKPLSEKTGKGGTPPGKNSPLAGMKRRITYNSHCSYCSLRRYCSPQSGVIILFCCLLL